MLKVIKFSAVWCAPCRAMTPVWNQIVTEYDDVTFEEIDIDEDAKTPAEFKINSIPTFLFLSGKKEVARIVGVIGSSELRQKIDELKE